MASVEVCNNVYGWKEKDFEGSMGPGLGLEDELEGYVELDCDQIGTPSIYQRIFSRKLSRKVS